MKTVIIIPTYNECGNIGKIIDALQMQFELMSHEMHILVVDDESPDGTADVVNALKATHMNVHLISGKKRGLGAAYIRGMEHALNKMGADVVFEMDADFSHDPEDVPRLMSEIESGTDFVIGSRYVKGGKIPKEWGLLRRLNSLGGNIVARFVAGIYQVKDCTAGFRAIRAPLLRKVNLDEITVQGYAFQIALLHACYVEGAKIKEIPTIFIDREWGESKLNIKDILEFIWNAWWIRFNASKTFIKFLIVGGMGVVVNLGTFTALLAAGLNKFIASPLAIELSIVFNFFLNNYWTFRWRNTKSRTRVKGLKFNIVSFLALSVSYGTFVTLSLTFPKGSPQLHQFLGIIPATFVNYFLNSYWTFRESESVKNKAD